MSSAVPRDSVNMARSPGDVTNYRAQALADRLMQGAEALASFASSLTDVEWQTHLPGDGRKIGVIVHHVASVYPVEIQLAQTIAAGMTVRGLIPADIDQMNGNHAVEFDGVAKQAAIELLWRNSAAAAAVIRQLTDEELDRAVQVSLYGDAPLTCQFVLEDHAVRHSYHHFARIRAALRR